MINAQVRRGSFGSDGIFMTSPLFPVEVLCFSDPGQGYPGIIPGDPAPHRVKIGPDQHVGIYPIPLFTPPEQIRIGVAGFPLLSPGNRPPLRMSQAFSHNCHSWMDALGEAHRDHQTSDFRGDLDPIPLFQAHGPCGIGIYPEGVIMENFRQPFRIAQAEGHDIGPVKG